VALSVTALADAPRNASVSSGFDAFASKNSSKTLHNTNVMRNNNNNNSNSNNKRTDDRRRDERRAPQTCRRASPVASASTLRAYRVASAARSTPLSTCGISTTTTTTATNNNNNNNNSNKQQQQQQQKHLAGRQGNGVDGGGGGAVFAAFGLRQLVDRAHVRRSQRYD
jgi:hypothetical protein